MMKKYIYTLLAATVALPCATAQELDSTPSVSDLTQITKLEEKKAQLKARNEVFKTNQAMNKAVTDMLKVKKGGDAVDELVKYYLLIDTSAPANEVNWMRGTCLGRMLGIAVSLKDRQYFDKALALFDNLEESHTKNNLRSFINSQLGPYQGKVQLDYVVEFYEREKAKMDPSLKLRVLPAILNQHLRFYGDLKKTEYFLKEIMAVKNPNDPKDPKKKSHYDKFEGQRIGSLNSGVCRTVEYKPEYGEKVLATYKNKFSVNQMGNIYLSFCKTAVEDKDRALFDKMLANIKAMPKSDKRAELLRGAAGAVSKVSGDLRHKILDDFLAEPDITVEQKLLAIIFKIDMQGYWNYGFYNPGSYERTKALILQATLIAKENKLEKHLDGWIRNKSLEMAFAFGDYAWFRQLLAELVAIDKAAADKQAENTLARAANDRKRTEDQIANRIKNETAELSRIAADAERKAKAAKKPEEAAKIKADAEKKITERKAVFAQNAEKDKETIAKMIKWIGKLEGDAAIARLGYTKRWKYMVLDLMLQNKDAEAIKILADAAKREPKNNEVAVLKYYLEGGDFAGFDKAFADRKFTSEQKMNEIRRAGATFFQAKRFEKARQMNDDVMKHMFRPAETNRRYTVKYLANAPKTAEAWAMTKGYEDWNGMETRFMPYYGYDVHNDKLLLKDTKLPELKDAYKTGIQVVFDEYAVHVYLRTDDPEIEKVLLGQLNGPQLEWTFRPGPGHAYRTFFFTGLPGSDDPHYVNWAGATKNYKLTYDVIKKDATITKNGFAAHFMLPWSEMYQTLPLDGKYWELGVCVWGRGTRTLNGLVHELSRCVKLDFQITPEQLKAIKRSIAIQAYNKYKRIRSNSGGFIQNWNDYLLGDPDFYKECLVDYLKELDDAGAKLMSGKATDAEMDAIYEKYVPQWNEISYMVSEKRNAYLKKQMFAK